MDIGASRYLVLIPENNCGTNSTIGCQQEVGGFEGNAACSAPEVMVPHDGMLSRRQFTTSLSRFL